MGESFWLGERPGKLKTGPMQEMMQQRAMGQGGPSAAELMMNRGMGQQVAAGRSMAASMPGVSPGLAMRQAGQREASAMSNVGQQTGIMRAQEQAAAQSMLANWLAQQDRMKLEQDMYNAARQQRQGMLGTMLGVGGQMGAAALGMPWGGGQPQGDMNMGGGMPAGWGMRGNSPDPYAAGNPGDYGW